MERVKEANNGETTEAFAELGRLRGRRGVHPQLPEHLLGRPPDAPTPPTAPPTATRTTRSATSGTGEGRRAVRSGHPSGHLLGQRSGRRPVQARPCATSSSRWSVNGAESGLFPVVDRDRLPEHVYAMLAATRRHRQHRHHRRRADRHAGHRGQRRQGRPSVSARRTPPTPCPPTSDSTTRPPPPAPCRRTSRPRASPPTRWSARPGPPSTRRSAPCTSTASPVIEGLLNAVHLDHPHRTRGHRGRSCSPIPARPSA